MVLTLMVGDGVNDMCLCVEWDMDKVTAKCMSKRLSWCLCVQVVGEMYVDKIVEV